MSLHQDILHQEIIQGIVDRLPVNRIIERIRSTLLVLDYNNDFIQSTVTDTLSTAYDMSKQKEGTYRITSKQLEGFIKELTLKYELNLVNIHL